MKASSAKFVLAIVAEAERLSLDIDVGGRVDEGEIEPRLKLWESLLSLRWREMEREKVKGQLSRTKTGVSVSSPSSL